jgi:twitching motility protein PilT
VIVIGEARDTETINVAITAGEVGHLVITTLHTTSAPVTVDRILNSFPAESRSQVATQLSTGLIGITSQRLIHCAGGAGRLPAVEIMTGSPTVKKLIEEIQTADLHAAIRESEHFGMQTMNQALEKLYVNKAITFEEAFQHSSNPAELKQMLRRA